jgi:hypothetical protein
MIIETMAAFIIVWFLLGLVSGLVCSWIDYKYNNFRRYEWITPFKMSFLGPILLIWIPYFYACSVKKINDGSLEE